LSLWYIILFTFIKDISLKFRCFSMLKQVSLKTSLWLQGISFNWNFFLLFWNYTKGSKVNAVESKIVSCTRQGLCTFKRDRGDKRAFATVHRPVPNRNTDKRTKSRSLTISDSKIYRCGSCLQPQCYYVDMHHTTTLSHNDAASRSLSASYAIMHMQFKGTAWELSHG